MEIKVFDMHTDLLTYGFCREVTLDLIEKENSNGNELCLAVFSDDAKERLDYYKQFSCNNRLCVENCGGLNENDVLDFKPYYASLTWNYDNEYAGGAITNGFITQKGINLINLFNENNIILDLAHIGKNSFFKAIEIANKVIVSHACCFSVHNHFRNFTDEQIKLIVEKNGIFGICFVSDFICDNRKAEVYDVAKHIDYFCTKFSFKNLAIGTDFYGTKNGVNGINEYCDLFKLYDLLAKWGYNKNVIDDIFYNNVNLFKF